MAVQVKNYSPFALTGRTFGDETRYFVQHVKGREEGMIISGTKTSRNSELSPFELILSQAGWFRELPEVNTSKRITTVNIYINDIDRIANGGLQST